MCWQGSFQSGQQRWCWKYISLKINVTIEHHIQFMTWEYMILVKAELLRETAVKVDTGLISALACSKQARKSSEDTHFTGYARFWSVDDLQSCRVDRQRRACAVHFLICTSILITLPCLVFAIQQFWHCQTQPWWQGYSPSSPTQLALMVWHLPKTDSVNSPHWPVCKENIFCSGRKERKSILENAVSHRMGIPELA